LFFTIEELKEEDMNIIAIIVRQKKIPTNDRPLVISVTCCLPSSLFCCGFSNYLELNLKICL
jgi:hypothetical protein